ncbi:hypothetical protein AXA88_01790 [Salmonella enterica]|nr:hypothetical protein [Salmonella enterica]EDK4035444.1 hypothetical protein [Salmonella enterica subsp. salamae]EAX3604673.1 hypothetical protein [Salmonella enterica]EGW6278554.1 hypothetical protein [Salmonella enterica]EGX3932731.1 hypothetical protein [Salmonella enterica]
MEFSKLPHEVQVIAAQCLAEKMNIALGLSDDYVKGQSAKNQGLQVRDAFIALFSDRELDGEKRAAKSKAEGRSGGSSGLGPI